MKYLKLFEEREIEHQYLEDDALFKLKDFVDDFIEKLDIDNQIDNLKLSNFTHDFDYGSIWDELVVKGNYNTDTNIYRQVDELFRKAFHPTPAVRNSLSKLLDRKYNALGIEDKLDKKLIDLFEKNPQKYKKVADNIYISGDVKDACEWILSSDKYNL